MISESAEYLFQSESVSISGFRCPPGDPRWATDNLITLGSQIVFPWTSVRIKHQGGRGFVADSNQVMFYNNHQVYTRSCLTEYGDRALCVHFDDSVLVDAVRAYDPSVAERPQRPFAFAYGPCSPHNYLRQHLLHRELVDGHAADAIRVQEACLEMLHDAVGGTYAARSCRRHCARRGTERAHAECAEAVKTFLAQHYRERCSLEHIARAVAVSPYHLTRVFRRRTGLTMTRYLSRLRLRASLEEVADPRMRLLDVALGLGFANHSHFTDAFRREFGIRPSTVRSRSSLRELPEMGRSLDN